MQAEEVKEKYRETSLRHWGVSSPFQSEEVKEKVRQTMIKKYGVEYGLQSEEIKAKFRKTMLSRYGVEYALQYPEFLEKQKRSSYSKKEYKLPSSSIVICQGYEPFCFNDLLKEGVSEEELLAGVNSGLTIKYQFYGSKRTYYPDVYLSSSNKIIEVKSEHTFQHQNERLIAKLSACRDQKFVAELRIYSGKGKRIPIPVALENLQKAMQKLLKSVESEIFQNAFIVNLICSYLQPTLCMFDPKPEIK